MLLAAVFLVSLSSLAFEVLLARTFAISQWNHLAFMVISIALFGFGASGTYLSLLANHGEASVRRLARGTSLRVLMILYSASAMLSFMALNRLPIDYFRLPIEIVQTLYLGAAYIMLALPFFFSGLVVSLAYALTPGQSGLVYSASMLGSAGGAALSMLLLPYWGEERLIVLMAVVPLAIVVGGFYRPAPAADGGAVKPAWARVLTTGGFLLVGATAVGLLLPSAGDLIRIHPVPYKALSQTLLLPHSSVTDRRWSIRGRMEKVDSPYVRFAPGLSLKFNGRLPPQKSIFRDGDERFVLYDGHRPEDWHFAKFTLPFVGYHLAAQPRRVLLIQGEGGSAIACALAAGAQDITVLAPVPAIRRAIRGHYGLRVVDQNVRTFLRSAGSRYQIIHLENWGYSLPGSAALKQEYLLTVEAMQDYLRLLSPDGILIVARRLLLPPGDMLRLWATAWEALTSLGADRPADHIAVLRNWDTYTLIVAARPLTDGAAITDFARQYNFDVVFSPLRDSASANRFNVFEKPFHFDALEGLARAYGTGREQDFFGRYLLDVAPQTDARPFPGQILKWRRAKALYRATGSRLYGLLMSGAVVVAVVFVEALVIALLLLMIPLAVFRGSGRRISFFQGLYFVSLGAGFMFIELYYIKIYALLWEDPVVSMSVVLAALMVCSGAGGVVSQRITARVAGAVLGLLLLLLVVTGIFMDDWLHRILALPLIPRSGAALALMLPVAFVSGWPFPLGMRCLLSGPLQRAYAWSANGCASVLAAIASAQIAISLGIPAILIGAGAAYLLAWICLRRMPS